MPEPAKTESVNPDDERLAHALISRGLLTREEFQQFRASNGALADAKPEEILSALVKRGFLTAHQARRAGQELSQLLDQRIPGYILLEKLGQGSMGTVYKAKQISMNRLVAIKELTPKISVNRDFIERFQREAHLAAKFSSNNVVQAIDVGSAGDIHYFVMEYVEGTTIKQEFEKGRIFEEQEAVEIVLQIAEALHQAHKRGLIHRDIKPANIILTADGVAKLADLGMAREMDDRALMRAEKGMTIGTPYYIAPEQIRTTKRVDSRADIYSLGATLYHMVTGQPPFPGKKVDEVLQAHLTQELTPPDHINTKLSAGLGEVVEFMMAKHRKARYQTPEDLIIDLECLARGDPPKLARQRLEAASLKALAKGEADEDEEETEEEPVDVGMPWMWAYVLVGVLAVSLLLNLLLLLR